MFATSAAVLALAAAVAYAQDLSIQTPSLTQCANSVINYSGGTGPYYVAILHGQDPCDHDAIQEFYNVNDNSVSYTPVLSSGTQVIVYVEDSNGQEAWSDPITLGNGDSSCLGPPTPNQDTSYTPPAEDPSTYNPPTYNPPNTYTPSTDTPSTDTPSTDNSTTDDGTDQSPPDDSSSSSSSAAPNSSTSTTFVAPYNPAPTTTKSTESAATDNSSVSVQNTNNSNTDTNKDTTPANANNKTGSATGLAVSALAALSAVLVVSFGLF